jgi:hypothetical protein
MVSAVDDDSTTRINHEGYSQVRPLPRRLPDAISGLRAFSCEGRFRAVRRIRRLKA